MQENRFESLIPEPILKLKPYVAGKTIEDAKRDYNYNGEFVKLASNENPLGPSPKAVEAIKQQASGIHRYPDTAGRELRRLLAERHQVRVENVILGGGSESIMSYIMRTFLRTDDEVLSVNSTFVGFLVMAHSRVRPPVLVPLNDYRFDLEALSDKITDKTKIVYLCNPNNPTGTYFTKQELNRFLERLPERVLVILDEAYYEFAHHLPDFPDSMVYRHDQVITLRTFSKAYGLAGVRIGYGLAHDYLIKNLYKVKLPFDPSDLAQAAGCGAMRDQEFLEKTLRMNDEGREYFYKEFDRLGLNYKPTASNFIMCIFESEQQVEFVYEQMMRRGVIIRPLKGFGLPHCLRVTIGTMHECHRCVEAFEQVLALL